MGVMRLGAASGERLRRSAAQPRGPSCMPCGVGYGSHLQTAGLHSRDGDACKTIPLLYKNGGRTLAADCLSRAHSE